MEQHPIPRQITTFEYKLIGFFTVKQFLYIIVFAPIGYIVYMLFPIPYINIILGVLIGSIGFAFALVPINDRPLDVWVRNLFKRLISPTQYIYQKHNPPIYFFTNLYFAQDPHRVLSHVDSQEKLAAYLAQTMEPQPEDAHKKRINSLLANSHAQPPLQATSVSVQKVEIAKPSEIKPETEKLMETVHASPVIVKTQQQPVQSPKAPFFTGVIKNHRQIPIPGILLYVKDKNGQTLRLLKTNPHGVFATFNPLPADEYSFEIKDPRGTYFFDTMKLPIGQTNMQPIEFYSKELL